jgi:hypothetical protein
MGGNVAITVKEENGNLWKMDRWTNIVPYFFSDVNLYNGNFSHWLKDFTKQWLVMKEDYEKNKDTGQFQENMTSVYFPFDTTSPSEYGLIVVDAQKKKIYSAQDYTSVGCINLHHLKEKDAQENFQELVNEGFIKYVSYMKEVGPRQFQEQRELIPDINIFVSDIQAIMDTNYAFFEKESPKSLEFQQTLCEPLKSIENLSIFNCFVDISSDWEFFSTDAQYSRQTNCLSLFEQLMKDDWQFSQEDYHEWQNYFLNYLDYEDSLDLTHVNKFNTLVAPQWQITAEMIHKISEKKKSV